ncbi:T9SS type A sorting domain-containing protein [Hymenobacter terricola]|uniref:T9SS type A sorting domain-containing protein n=1 Tax=Hymenobacter terricola TaxID=2819236 RepID=UPI001B300CE1|nr:T9SS type A sorting domain-containing protein [Hymenobacter terricola]
MKHFFSLLTLLGALTAAPAQAQQLPNSGFETWTTRTGNQVPQGYVTSDDFAQRLIGFGLGSVTQSTAAHGGQYAARVAGASILGQNVPGVLVLGDIARLTPASAANFSFRGGLPYTAKPARLQFWYRFSGAAQDSAVLYLELRQGPRATARTIALGTSFLVAPANATTVYTLGTLPLTYGAGTFTPDTLRFTTVVGSTRSAGSAVLLLDDLSLSGGVLATTPGQAASAAVVYPNPSAGGRFVIRTPDAALAAAPLTVRDALGRTVLALPARSAAGPITERELDLSSQARGLYLLSFEVPGGGSRRLVVE